MSVAVLHCGLTHIPNRQQKGVIYTETKNTIRFQNLGTNQKLRSECDGLSYGLQWKYPAFDVVGNPESKKGHSKSSLCKFFFPLAINIRQPPTFI